MGNFRGDRHGSGGGNFGRRDFGGRGRGFGGGRSFGGRDSGPREMFSATCSNCGKGCQVPFRPTNGKPVYCSDCFEKMNGGRSEGRRPERSDFRPAGGADQNKAQFDAINAKLDKILNILAPAPVVTQEKTKVEKEVEPIKEVKTEKSKKVVKKVSSAKKK